MNQPGHGSFMNNPSAVLSRSRPEVDDPVGVADEDGVMLHHHHRVPRGGKLPQDHGQPLLVPGVETHRGFVEYIERAGEGSPQGRGQGDPLGFSTRKGPGLPPQGDVSQTHVLQKLEPSADFPEEKFRRPVPRGGSPVTEELFRFGDGHLFHFRQGLVPQTEEKGGGLQPSAPTIGAGEVAPVAGQKNPGLLLVAAPLQPFEEPVDAVPGAVALSLPDPFLNLGGQLPPGMVGGDLLLPEKTEQVFLALEEGRGLERFDAALGDAHPSVGDDQVGIDVDDPPEPVAGLAGTDGVVERKDGRRGISVVEVAPLAVELLAEAPRFPFPFDPRLHAPFAEAERGLHRVHDPSPAPGVDEDPVENHGNRPVSGLQLGLFHRNRPPVLQHAGKPRLPENFPQRCGGYFSYPTGEADKGILPGRLRQEVIQDHGGGITVHRAPAPPAVERGGPREERAEVVVDGSHGPHRRPGGPHRGGPADGDGRKDVVDPLGLRAVQPFQELAGVGRKSLHVPPVSFGIKNIEGQGGLAGPGHAGHEGHRPHRDMNRDPLEVVLPRSFNVYRTDWHSFYFSNL